MTAESSLSQACGKCLSAGPAQGSAKVEKTVRIDFISLGGSSVCFLDKFLSENEVMCEGYFAST